MVEFRPHNLPRTSTHEERAEAFGAWFDMDVDPATELAPLVLRLIDSLDRIVGTDVVGPGLAALRADVWPESEVGLKGAEDSENYLDWPLSEGLQILLAYGLFGICGTRDWEVGNMGVVERELATLEALLADCPPEGWLLDPHSSLLLATLAMARGRWELDHRRNVAPEALALLGGVKMSRIRNMLAGESPDLQRDVGLVLYEPAMAWLSKRDVFLPTIRSQEPRSAEPGDTSDGEGGLLASPVFLPVARDGSMFHPGVARDGGYWVGPKSDEQKIEGFDEALVLLQRMDVARWRRPNPNGNWGIVAAVEWRRMDRVGLDALAEAASG